MKARALLLLLSALTLSACGRGAQSTRPALPTVVLDAGAPQPPAPSPGKGGVTASGSVVPGRQARLACALSEQVTTVHVAVGDRVKAGQALVSLDGTALRVQYRQAEASLAVAQANYAVLAAGPPREQVRQAQAALNAARAAYTRVTAPAREADIQAARAALDAAQASYSRVKAGPRKEDYAAAEANLRTAEAALRQAQSAYDRALARNPAGIGGDPAALALEKATNDYHAAQALYAALSRPPDEAQLSAAHQQVLAAQAQLDRLLQPAPAYDVAQAQAQVDGAQARLDELQAGTRPEQLAVAQAQIVAAQAALSALEVQRPKYTLVAPWDAVLVSCAVQPGEMVLPGAPVVVLADLDRLRVETTDLSERDVPQIEVGQPVTVWIKALNQSVAGRVSEIAPLPSTLGGDVVYKATVDLEARPAGLRPGMSVEVQFR